jgi:hypothetical protein
LPPAHEDYEGEEKEGDPEKPECEGHAATIIPN